MMMHQWHTLYTLSQYAIATLYCCILQHWGHNIWNTHSSWLSGFHQEPVGHKSILTRRSGSFWPGHKGKWHMETSWVWFYADHIATVRQCQRMFVGGRARANRLFTRGLYWQPSRRHYCSVFPPSCQCLPDVWPIIAVVFLPFPMI